MPGFEALCKELHLSTSSFQKLLKDLTKTPIEGYFAVWVQRKKLSYTCIICIYVFHISFLYSLISLPINV